jgi:hypothetical protein
MADEAPYFYPPYPANYANVVPPQAMRRPPLPLLAKLNEAL